MFFDFLGVFTNVAHYMVNKLWRSLGRRSTAKACTASLQLWQCS